MNLIKLDPHAIVPTKATDGSAAYDLYSLIDIFIAPDCVSVIPTGIAIHINNPNVAALILPRSGLSTKEGITVANTPGLIDSDYQGELKVALLNRRPTHYQITKGMPIVQLLFIPIYNPVDFGFTIVDTFDTTSQRGAGGFGSTGS